MAAVLLWYICFLGRKLSQWTYSQSFSSEGWGSDSMSHVTIEMGCRLYIVFVSSPRDIWHIGRV